MSLSVRLSCATVAFLISMLIGSEIFAVLSAVFWAIVGTLELPPPVLTVALWLAAALSVAATLRLGIYVYGVERRNALFHNSSLRPLSN